MAVYGFSSSSFEVIAWIFLESISPTFYARIFLYESVFFNWGKALLYEKRALEMLMKLTPKLMMFGSSEKMTATAGRVLGLNTSKLFN